MRNFASLSPSEFERLVRDLLQAEWNERLETFPDGPDGGIDVRLIGSGLRIIIQCKHSPYGTWSTIRGFLEREARTRNGAQLKEFWLVTSARLTAYAKDEASRIFAEHGLVPEHILGRDDLENLLNLHPKIEQRHLRLYATNLPILISALHQPLTTRRHTLERTITEQASRLAWVDSADRALDTLIRRGFCIIAGPAGIGKTALAKILLNHLMSHGYSLYDITELNEIDTAWNPDLAQVFYCDDFLGQLAVEPRLEHRQDLILRGLLSRLPDERHLIILTTRGHILADAFREHQALAESHLRDSVVSLEPDAISYLDRAKILSTQMRNAGMGFTAFESIRHQQRHLEAIRHPNYSPRITHQAIESTMASHSSQEEFPGLLLDSLSDPRELWSYVFWKEMNEVDRLVLLALSTFPYAKCALEALTAATKALYGYLGGGSYLPFRTTQESILSLDQILVKLSHTGVEVIVEFANPGVREFVLGEIAGDRSLFAAMTSLQCEDGNLTELLSWTSPEAYRRPRPFRDLEGSKLKELRAVLVATVASITCAECSNHKHGPWRWQPDERTVTELIKLFIIQKAETADLIRESVPRLSKQWSQGKDKLDDILSLIQAVWPHIDATARAELTAHSESQFRSGENWWWPTNVAYFTWLETVRGVDAASESEARFIKRLADELEALTNSTWEITYGPKGDRDADSDYRYFEQAPMSFDSNERFDKIWERYYQKWKTYNKIWNEQYERELETQKAADDQNSWKPQQRPPSAQDTMYAAIDKLFE